MGNTTKRLLSIGICDDDELILTTMRTICQHYLSEIKLDMCLHTYNSCKALLASSEIRTMDILFLDIEIDTLHSGIDVKNFMQLRHSNCLIVFITSHNELMHEAFGKNVCGFIQKPIDKQEVTKKLAELIKITTADDQILYIKAEGNYHRIYYLNGESILNTGNIKEIENSLDNSVFFRCHKSYIINMVYITYYNSRNSTVTMENGEVIQISRRKVASFKKAYANFSIRYYRLKNSI